MALCSGNISRSFCACAMASSSSLARMASSSSLLSLRGELPRRVSPPKRTGSPSSINLIAASVCWKSYPLAAATSATITAAVGYSSCNTLMVVRWLSVRPPTTPLAIPLDSSEISAPGRGTRWSRPSSTKTYGSSERPCPGYARVTPGSTLRSGPWSFTGSRGTNVNGGGSARADAGGGAPDPIAAAVRGDGACSRCLADASSSCVCCRVCCGCELGGGKLAPPV